MSKFKIAFLTMVGASLLTIQSRAQTTNEPPVVPATILEELEATTGQVVVKGSIPVGTISAAGAVISVVCKQDFVPGTIRKEHGISVGISFEGQSEDRTVVDYDEIDSLRNAVDYLAKITWSVTPTTSFEASYTTKGGLRVAAFSSHRTDQIRFALRSSRMTRGVLLAPEQLSALQSLLEQAKEKLDDLRKA